MKQIPEVLQKIYKKEYQTTDITKDQLLQKYQLVTEQLSDFDSWTKQSNIVPISQPKPAIVEEELSLQQDVVRAKELLISTVLHKLEVDKGFLEVKELKGLSDIVSSLEDKKADTGPTVNVLIQNLTERFKDDI